MKPQDLKSIIIFMALAMVCIYAKSQEIIPMVNKRMFHYNKLEVNRSGDSLVMDTKIFLVRRFRIYDRQNNLIEDFKPMTNKFRYNIKHLSDEFYIIKMRISATDGELVMLRKNKSPE